MLHGALMHGPQRKDRMHDYNLGEQDEDAGPEVDVLRQSETESHKKRRIR